MSEIDVYKEWLGIPEGNRPPDHYTLLRLLQFEDDIEKIRTNYRKLNTHVRKYSTGQYLLRSQELLNEMAKAMLCLTDPDGKREYDQSLGRESSKRAPLPRGFWRKLAQRASLSRSFERESPERASLSPCFKRELAKRASLLPGRECESVGSSALFTYCYRLLR